MDQGGATLRSFDAMGTRFECVLGAFARPSDLAGHDSLAAAVCEEIQAIVTDWHDRLSVFDPRSAVSIINERAGEQPAPLDSDLYDLLERCEDHTRATDGAFDPAAGTLMHRYGFRGEPGPEPMSGGPLGYRLDADRRSVSFTSPDTRLDFGAIAKGMALDLARDEMLDQGVASALVQGGTSSAVAIGTAPDAQPWRIQLASDDPGAPIIELTDRALAYSSPEGRRVAGRGHIMDPRTGQPAKGSDAACVVGPSAEVCEVWSTALVVAPELLDRLPIGYDAHVRRADVWHSFVPSPLTQHPARSVRNKPARVPIPNPKAPHHV